MIGQLHGGKIGCPTSSASFDKYYGKFNVSWTGSLTSTPASDNRRRLDYWLAPGLSIQPQTPQTLNGTFAINGPAILCTNFSSSYYVTNLPAGFTWGSSSNINLSGSGTNITALGTSIGVGYITIKNNLGIEVSRKDLWVGYPDAQLGGPENVSSYGWYNVQYSAQSNPSFYWYVNVSWPNQYVLYDHGDNAEVYFLDNAIYEVSVEASNSCGCNGALTKYVYAYPGRSPSPFTVYPNPVNDILYIVISAGYSCKICRYRQEWDYPYL